MNDDLPTNDLPTSDLDAVLFRRAERAPEPQSPDEVVGIVTARAESHARRRHNRFAIAGGTTVAIAVAVIGIAIADAGSGSGSGSHHPAHRQALGSGAPSHPRHRVHPVDSADATQLPVIRILPSGADHRHSINYDLHRFALESRARQHAATQRRAREQAATSASSLVRVDAAPSDAEISIGLVPKGFGYLSHDAANSYYGPAGLSPDDYFSKGIVVDVHLTVRGTKFPMTIDSKPASYDKSGGYTVVRIEYTKKVDVGFQAPPNVTLTKAQAVEIAATLDVRSTAHKTRG